MDRTIFIKREQQEDLQRERLERFTQFFNRVNSAFAMRRVNVKVDNSPQEAPAWSNAHEVTFNSRLIGDLDTPADIANVKGLNLHEISHVMFTSREGSDLVDWVVTNKLWQSFNALEDSRIETLFTTRYPSTIAWFTATITKYFLENAEAFDKSYPLLCGRRYLPVEIRTQSRLAYIEPQNCDSLSDIVNEYRTLVFPRDTERGKELIQAFNDLLPKGTGGHGYKPTNDPNEADVVILTNDPFGHGSRPNETIESVPTSRPLSPKQQDRVANKAKQDSLSKLNDDKELAEALANKPVIDLRNSDSDSPTDSKSDSQSNSDSDSQSDSKSDTPSKKAGDKTAELLKQSLDKILNESHVAQEIREIINQIAGKPVLETNDSQIPEHLVVGEITPDVDTFNASHLLNRSLERLKEQYDPSWVRFKGSGRLNIGRYMRQEDFDSIFDQWNEGVENATSISCVILLDNSGSMQGDKATKSYRAMFSIKRALDKLGADTSVFTFDTNVRTLYRADEKASQTIRNGGTFGGTDPNSAIKVATKLLAESERPVKIFFVITDGEWEYRTLNDNHEMIDRLANAGVLTAFAYIPDGDSIELNTETMHHCEVGAIVNNPLDLVELANQLVHYAVTRRLVNN